MENLDPVEVRKSTLLDHLPSIPALWDLSHGDYKNKQLKETIAATLDQQLNFEAGETLKLVKRIKDSFGQQKRQYAQRQLSGSGKATEPTWPHWSKCQFLNDHVGVKSRTSSNLPRLEKENEDSDPSDQVASFEDYESDSSTLQSTIDGSPLFQTSCSAGPGSPSVSPSGNAAKRPRQDSIVSNQSVEALKHVLDSYADNRSRSRNERKTEPEKNRLPRYVEAYGTGLLDKLTFFSGRRFLEVTKKIDDLIHFEIMSDDCDKAVESHFN